VAQTRHIDFDTAHSSKDCERVLPGLNGGQSHFLRDVRDTADRNEK
jgi:hypothetical protein